MGARKGRNLPGGEARLAGGGPDGPAARLRIPGAAELTLTLTLALIRERPPPSAYQPIVEEFHRRFGPRKAGWAFMTLFVAGLADFRKLLRVELLSFDRVYAATASDGYKTRANASTARFAVANVRSRCVHPACAQLWKPSSHIDSTAFG